jgi:hypothetical protein
MGDLFWSLARNTTKDSTASDASASLSHPESRSNVLLDKAHQALSERVDEHNLLAGDDDLKAKDEVFCQAILEVAAKFDPALPVEEQFQALLDRDIRAVLALEKAALELYEGLLDRVEGGAAVKEEVRGELGRWRTGHEEKMRAEREREMSMDEFERRYG